MDGRWRLPRFTWRDAEALVRLGIIPEDASTELLNGLIVLKDRAARGQDSMTVGNNHTVCVERLSDLRGRINNAGRHVRSQQRVEHVLIAAADVTQTLRGVVTREKADVHGSSRK